MKTKGNQPKNKYWVSCMNGQCRMFGKEILLDGSKYHLKKLGMDVCPACYQKRKMELCKDEPS